MLWKYLTSCLIEASVSFHRKFFYRQSCADIASKKNGWKVFDKIGVPVRPRSHSEILLIPQRSPAHNSLVRTTKIRLRWSLRPLHITICYLSTVSSVDARIGCRTSPRRTTSDVGGIRLVEAGTVQQQLSSSKEARKKRGSSSLHCYFDRNPPLA